MRQGSRGPVELVTSSQARPWVWISRSPRDMEPDGLVHPMATGERHVGFLPLQRLTDRGGLIKLLAGLM